MASLPALLQNLPVNAVQIGKMVSGALAVALNERFWQDPIAVSYAKARFQSCFNDHARH
jgi:hypothetical protein